MVEGKGLEATSRKEPLGLRWRSSVGFVTFGEYLFSTVSCERILNFSTVVMFGTFLRQGVPVYLELTRQNQESSLISLSTLRSFL